MQPRPYSSHYPGAGEYSKITPKTPQIAGDGDLEKGRRRVRSGRSSLLEVGAGGFEYKRPQKVLSRQKQQWFVELGHLSVCREGEL